MITKFNGGEGRGGISFGPQFSDECKDLILKLLKPNPALRCLPPLPQFVQSLLLGLTAWTYGPGSRLDIRSRSCLDIWPHSCLDIWPPGSCLDIQPPSCLDIQDIQDIHTVPGSCLDIRSWQLLGHAYGPRQLLGHAVP